MTKILGLDLGTNSIGWAVVDSKNNKIAGIGTRIFPMGVNMVKGNEESKNETRRIARGTRRSYFRRKMRKNLLLKELQHNKMSPVSEINLKEWFKENPYKLRQRAINESVSLLEIGRIFYHLIQRRGFKSNRKAGGAEENEKSTIFKGDAKSGKIGISETQTNLKEYKTLGDYFASINPHEERIRNRYTTRKMYIDEFNAIWEVQKKYHPEILNDKLKSKIGINEKGKETGILFYQRPLRSQNHLIGKCTFEPTKSRCPISALVFEQCRAWQWAHTVEYNGNKLTKEERELILNLLLSKDKLTFKDIKKALKLSSEVYSFNYKDDDKIVGSYTISKLSKVFDKEWDVMTEQQKEDAWHIIYTATDDEWLTQYAKAKWNFNEKQLKAITSINFKQDYAQLSRKALNNILEFLPDYRYDEAVVLAGVKNAFNKEWNNFDTDKKNEIINAIADIVLNNENYIDYVKEYLKNDYNLSDADLKKLYHHSEKIEKGKRYDKLPVSVDADKEISSLRNPIVTQALFELRNLINNLIDEHGKFDEIKVEMARDLKTSAKVRLETRTKQKQLEVANDEVKKKLEKRNLDLTHDNILKYKLWEECKHICPYTGNEIALSILFTGEIQIEHIVPWSRSLNDSFMNKTLCFADENRAKGDKTPYEYYGNDEHKWEEVKDRAKKLFANPNSYNKFKTFVKQTIDTDFISRQLNDTRYISKEAKNYLEKICANVKVAPGQMTANLRHHWGLNKILSGDDNKTRDDHRHHAVDALVMACFTQNHLQEISKWNRYNRTYEMQAITKPWESFWIDAKTAIDTILVSHKANKRILTTRNHTTEKNGKKHTNTGVAARGQLHKETVYGQHKDVKGETFYHMRKPLEAIDNKAKVGKIADIQIQKLVIQAIEKAGGYIGDKKDKVPPNAFFKSDENGNKIPLVYLKNQNGNPVPIKKVRIKENSSGAVKLKDEINQWVEPGSNHHILIYKNSEGDLCEKVVTFWEAIERKKQKLPIYQLPDNGTEIVTALQINDMFLLGIKEEDINWNNPNHDFLKKYLYRIQKLTSGDYWFRFHLASSLENDLYKQIRGFGNGKTGWFNFNPIKVTVTPTGKIKKLN